MLACWLALKLIHEAAHGLACVRYGGRVREFGVLFFLLLPLPYLDLSSASGLRSKWQRIAVSSAGMVAELWVAAAAAIVWLHAEPGVWAVTARNVALTASVTTIFFNANPLMRYDGYFILCDLLGVENLSTRGRQAAKRWFASMVGLARQEPRSNEAAQPSLFVLSYGIAAFTWQWFVFASLCVAGAVMLEGAGIVLALAAVVAAAFRIAASLRKTLFTRDDGGGIVFAPRRSRLTLALSLAFLAVIAIAVCPWPFSTSCPAIVRYANERTVRASVDGFVRELCVGDSANVSQGDVIAVLANDELVNELMHTEIAVENAALRIQSACQRGATEEVAVEQRRRKALVVRRDKLKKDVESLVVRAPISGTIVAPRLNELRGTYLSEGDEIVAIVQPDQLETHLVVRQELANSGRIAGSRLGTTAAHDISRSPVRVSWSSGLLTTGWVQRVSPTACITPREAELCAVHGGSVPVRPRAGAPNAYEYLQPQFHAEASLANCDTTRLRAGQRGVAVLPGTHPTVAQVLFETVDHWLQRKSGNKLRLSWWPE